MYDNLGKHIGLGLIVGGWLMFAAMIGCIGFIGFVAYRVLF